MSSLANLLPPPFGTLLATGLDALNFAMDLKYGGSDKKAGEKKVNAFKQMLLPTKNLPQRIPINQPGARQQRSPALGTSTSKSEQTNKSSPQRIPINQPGARQQRSPAVKPQTKVVSKIEKMTERVVEKLPVKNKEVQSIRPVTPIIKVEPIIPKSSLDIALKSPDLVNLKIIATNTEETNTNLETLSKGITLLAKIIAEGTKDGKNQNTQIPFIQANIGANNRGTVGPEFLTEIERVRRQFRTP